MKNLYTLFLLGLILQSCQTVDYLYYYDNTDVEKEIDSIPDCEGFARLVREHFMYNAKDSLYMRNIGYIYQIRLLDYRDCLNQLSYEQTVKIFGPPNDDYGNGVAAYFDNKAVVGAEGLLGYSAGATFFLNKKLKNMLEESDKFKKLRHYRKASTHFIPEGGVEFERQQKGKNVNDCFDYKKKMAEQVFIHKKTTTIFLNYSINDLNRLVRKKRESDPSCMETFTSNEIYSLFGEPHLVRNDTLFYQTINTPFMDKKKTHPEWKGKVYCVIFHPTEYKNYYKYGNLMVDPKELIGKKRK